MVRVRADQDLHARIAQDQLNVDLGGGGGFARPRWTLNQQRLAVFESERQAYGACLATVAHDRWVHEAHRADRVRRGHRGGRGDQANQVWQAASRAGQFFEQGALLLEDLFARTWPDKAGARWIRGGPYAYYERARTGMRVDHPSASARAGLIVEDLQPFAVVQCPQRVDRDAF